MDRVNTLADALRTALLSANNRFIEQFGSIQDSIEPLLQGDSLLDEEIRHLLENMDDRIDDLVRKIRELNDEVSQ